MAEDLMIGFEFKATEDDIAKDAAVWDASDNLFSEITFDHLPVRAETDPDTANMADIRDTERSDAFDNFDFAESFDFAL